MKKKFVGDITLKEWREAGERLVEQYKKESIFQLFNRSEEESKPIEKKIESDELVKLLDNLQEINPAPTNDGYFIPEIHLKAIIKSSNDIYNEAIRDAALNAEVAEDGMSVNVESILKLLKP